MRGLIFGCAHVSYISQVSGSHCSIRRGPGKNQATVFHKRWVASTEHFPTLISLFVVLQTLPKSLRATLSPTNCRNIKCARQSFAGNCTAEFTCMWSRRLILFSAVTLSLLVPLTSRSLYWFVRCRCTAPVRCDSRESSDVIHRCSFHQSACTVPARQRAHRHPAKFLQLFARK
jgi:hypothetical protein